ncbi:MAG: hypothetical protein ACR2PR_02310 [Pseudohongiellaceae bacterium]
MNNPIEAFHEGLEAVTKLKSAGFPETQAETIVDTNYRLIQETVKSLGLMTMADFTREIDKREFATKTDLSLLAQRLDTRIDALDVKIDVAVERLDTKISALNVKIDVAVERLEAKIRNSTYSTGVALGVYVTFLAGLMQLF